MVAMKQQGQSGVPPDDPTRRLIEALQRPERYPHLVDRVQVIETHISWILLAGEYAYKVKKPVDLGFVDFSTLELRRHYCFEELRLNSRLAPAIYLDVVAIRGAPERPVFAGSGPILEYAVRMRRFPDEALASRMLAAGTLEARHVSALAGHVAGFHESAPVAEPGTVYGERESILLPALDNIRQMLELGPAAEDRAALEQLAAWSGEEFSRREETFRLRKASGRVRECHGDLHLGNVVLLGDEMCAFDGIDFNDRLRWIDVMNEAAFTVMDFTAHGRPDLASLFLNTYLERTGDYDGLAVLRFYTVYRALVRAKVERLSAQDGDMRHAVEAGRYLQVAADCARAGRPALVIMHGLSGSGKTSAAAEFMQSLGAIRIRSDVERKRLAGINVLARSRSGAGAGLYAPDATQATYDHLGRLARGILESGYPVIVDAAFLQRRHRDAMRALAEKLRVSFSIVSLKADVDILRERITRRSAAGSDASDADSAVFDYQLRTQEPLSESELLRTLTIDAGHQLAGPGWVACVRDLATRSGLAAVKPRR
jgi:uncharacterized protein